MESFNKKSFEDYIPEKENNVYSELMAQYERVILETTITTFGLDAFVAKNMENLGMGRYADRTGGNVDTIHNVRKGVYVDLDNAAKYVTKTEGNTNVHFSNAIGEDIPIVPPIARFWFWFSGQPISNPDERYDSQKYHSDSRYIEQNRINSEKLKNGTLIDEYTGKKLTKDYDQDHIISAKEINDDPGRILAGLKGTDLANCPENLVATDPSINRSKKDKNLTEYANQHAHKLTENEYERMINADKKARFFYNFKINKAYYTSSKFLLTTLDHSFYRGVGMGIREVCGLIIVEMIYGVREEFNILEKKENFDFAETIKSIGIGLQKGLKKAFENYKELINKFFTAAQQGIFSNILTTIINTFFTTTKNVVKLIRQCFPSLSEAFKVLFINPKGYEFGDRIKAALKLISTAASIAVGVCLSSALGSSLIGQLPIVGSILPEFLGALATGLLSCSFLLFIDRSETFQALFKFCSEHIHTIDTEVNYFKKVAEDFDKYAAQLMDIDLEKFKNEVSIYSSVADDIVNAEGEDLNKLLLSTIERLGIEKPWKGDFDEFMGNTNNTLIFK